MDKEGVGIAEVDSNPGPAGVMGMTLGVVIGGFGSMIVEAILFNSAPHAPQYSASAGLLS